MKQVFQLIPRGSSNTMLQNKGIGKKMRKHCLVALLIIILFISFGLVSVNANISVSETYVAPGNTVDLVFTGTPGSEFTVTISGSRGVMENASLVFEDTGQYVWSYTVNRTAYTDSVKIIATIDGATVESGFIVSRMQPRQLAETVRLMAMNSKKQAESALIESRRAGEADPEMLIAYREAVQLLGNSMKYIEQGEHTKTLETIKSALTLFETIVEGTYSTNVTPSDDPSNKIRAQEALRTLKARLEEIDRTAKNLENMGFNADTLHDSISRMGSGLASAQKQIESNNIGEAIRLLSSVNENLKNVQSSINQRIQEYNRYKTSIYQASLLNRYNTMRSTLTVMQAANANKVSGVLTEMNAINSKLDEARALYESGDISGSIRKLHSADRDFKETFSGLNGEETRTILESLDTLTVQLEKETSPAKRMRIQMQIQSVKNTLKARLESVTSVSPQPPLRTPTNSTAEAHTPTS